MKSRVLVYFMQCHIYLLFVHGSALEADVESKIVNSKIWTSDDLRELGRLTNFGILLNFKANQIY